MGYSYFGCWVTNLMAFQSFINYPCTRQEIYGNYTRVLNREKQLWDNATNWTEEEQLNMKTPLQETTIPNLKNIVWTCRKPLGQTSAICVQLKALQGTDSEDEELDDIEIKQIRLRGCSLQYPLHSSVCHLINTFPVT